MIETLPSGIRLKNLIQDHHAEILSRERNNDKFVHLYSIGTYWVAFERSACRLNGIFQQCEIILFHIPNHLEYVVMVSVPDDEAETYFRKHLVFRDGYDYKVLAFTPLLSESYHQWHEVAVKSVLE